MNVNLCCSCREQFNEFNLIKIKSCGADQDFLNCKTNHNRIMGW